MKIKIWPDDATALEMDDWLAELRDSGRAEPSAPAPALVAPPAPAAPPAPVPARPEPPPVLAPATAPMRAIIGDQLRMPVTWCEIGSCISRHADPAALGEGDARARAMEAGWRTDAFGRLACPQCQQTDPGFRAPCPVVPWDRHAAIVRAARFVAVRAGTPVPGGQP